MRIEPFRKDDIGPFLELAAAENWVAEPWELEFLLSEFPQGCFAARSDTVEAAGFVTSLRHERSGWIGNLIVSAEYRGQGIGESLFVKALDTLRTVGVETVWLTASKSGMPLYQKFGFNSVDTIIRWVGTGRQRHATHDVMVDCSDLFQFQIKDAIKAARIEATEAYNQYVEEPKTSQRRGRFDMEMELEAIFNDIDGFAWDDRRAALVTTTVARGRLLKQKSGFVVVQPCGDALQIGPFSALDDSTADALLKAALHTIPFGKKVCLDAPASNRSALRLFNRKQMHIAGSNELMYAGVKPAYQADYVYGLATMGSCG